ncbi:MAG: aminotransferase class I/II-fold pyridoxal phosphate-dependent enzyme, partial [Campylobacterales bacterium]
MFQHLSNLKSYEPGRPVEEVVAQFGIKPEEVIKMASNENPLGPPPGVEEVVAHWARHLNRYPDDSYPLLKKGLANRFQVREEEILIGSGSDEVLKLAVQARAPKRILTAGVTFAMYEIFGRQIGAEVVKTPSPTHKMEQFLELYKKYRP